MINSNLDILDEEAFNQCFRIFFTYTKEPNHCDQLFDFALSDLLPTKQLQSVLPWMRISVVYYRSQSISDVQAAGTQIRHIPTLWFLNSELLFHDFANVLHRIKVRQFRPSVTLTGIQRYVSATTPASTVRTENFPARCLHIQLGRQMPCKN